MNPTKENKIHNKFTGEITIKTLSGVFIKGFRVLDGKITKKYLPKANHYKNKSNNEDQFAAECRISCGHSSDDNTCICNGITTDEIVVYTTPSISYISVNDLYGSDANENSSCEFDCDNTWNTINGGTPNNTNSNKCDEGYYFDNIQNTCVLFFDENYADEESYKPIYEYDDKCEGLDKLWAMSLKSGNEIAAVLTIDNAILIIKEGSRDKVNFPGLYTYFNGKTHYQYPTSRGAPARKYTGQVISAGRYFIPIKATIHSHTPCLTDGSDGITNRSIVKDKTLASEHNSINHYLIGCNAIGQFNSSSSNAFNIQGGNLGSLCNNIN